MFTRGLSYIAYLAVRLSGIKQKKSSWGSVMKKNLLFLPPLPPKPRSQVRILIYRVWSILKLLYNLYV